MLRKIKAKIPSRPHSTATADDSPITAADATTQPLSQTFESPNAFTDYRNRVRSSDDSIERPPALIATNTTLIEAQKSAESTLVTTTTSAETQTEGEINDDFIRYYNLIHKIEGLPPIDAFFKKMFPGDETSQLKVTIAQCLNRVDEANQKVTQAEARQAEAERKEQALMEMGVKHQELTSLLQVSRNRVRGLEAELRTERLRSEERQQVVANQANEIERLRHSLSRPL